MKVEPHRSKFKKITCQYNKDNVLDIIDIGDTLAKNRFIPKINENLFIFTKHLRESNKKNTTISPSKIIRIDSEINYEKFNHNKFHINFETLQLEYSNGYTVHLFKVYCPIAIIGEGGFGLVISAINRKTKRKEAIKIVDKSIFHHNEKDLFEREVKIMNQLNSPRILKVYEVLNTADYFFIFMELIEGGSLRELIVNRYKDENSYLFRDSECSCIMNGILEGLNYLHKQNIVHRDIKPDNIMFKIKDDFTSIVLCDFGMACHVDTKYVEGKCGTTLYMAPEIVGKRKYDYLIDSWSAGIILFILVSGGKHPLYKKHMNQSDYEEELLKKKLFEYTDHIPLLARNLFMKLCKYEPFYRLEPYKALKHPWITRSNKGQIPLTLVEEYEKEGKIKEFKSMLSTTMFFDMFKHINQMKIKQTTPPVIEDTMALSKISVNRIKKNSGLSLRITNIGTSFSMSKAKNNSLSTTVKYLPPKSPNKLKIGRNLKLMNLNNHKSEDSSQLMTTANRIINLNLTENPNSHQKKKRFFLKSEHKTNPQLINTVKKVSSFKTKEGFSLEKIKITSHNLIR